jgi:hypothetical protein
MEARGSELGKGGDRVNMPPHVLAQVARAHTPLGVLAEAVGCRDRMEEETSLAALDVFVEEEDGFLDTASSWATGARRCWVAR